MSASGRALEEQMRRLDAVLASNDGDAHEAITKLIGDQELLVKTCAQYAVDAGPQCVEFHQFAAMQTAKVSLKSYLDTREVKGNSEAFKAIALGSIRKYMARDIHGSQCLLNANLP